MSIDVSHFLGAFHEESLAGLATMESGLRAMQAGALDTKTLESVFRAVHSIKGGSATFGLSGVSEFAQVLESVLDATRAGKYEIDAPAADLLLSAVDCLRKMLIACKEDSALDPACTVELRVELERLLDNGAPASSFDVHDDADKVHGGWQIFYKPNADAFQAGNDPLQLLNELCALGNSTIHVDTSSLPAPEAFFPERCYLGWRIELDERVNRADIERIFERVMDECELSIVAPDRGASRDCVRATRPSESTEVSTATPRQKTDVAEQIDRRASTEDGGDVVKRAVTAMEAINASSNRIAEIIGVIDEIAFQTNLLALNASVEAARAGEQGSGFALVATEVRNLAQRSATAAREVKELIQESVEKVRGGGANLTHETDGTLQEIQSSVRKVGDIVAEMSGTTHEPSLNDEQTTWTVKGEPGSALERDAASPFDDKRLDDEQKKEEF